VEVRLEHHTDQIIPAKYAIYSLDEKELGKHAMEGVPGREGWSAGVAAGDILVADANFGCGSSREIAPVAIRGAESRSSSRIRTRESSSATRSTWATRSSVASGS